MNEILKQRLVGALILVALGVVFWPIIFVQTDRNDSAVPRSIPPPPGVSMTSVEAPDAAGLRASPELTMEEDSPVKNPDTTYVESGETSEAEGSPVPVQEKNEVALPPSVPAADSNSTRTEAPEPLKMNSDGIPLAWTLQVATLGSAEKADTLRKKLLDIDEKVYVTKVQQDGKTLYRVSIGPKFERVQLDRLRENIDAKFGVTSMVARYTP